MKHTESQTQDTKGKVPEKPSKTVTALDWVVIGKALAAAELWVTKGGILGIIRAMILRAEEHTESQRPPAAWEAKEMEPRE